MKYIRILLAAAACSLCCTCLAGAAETPAAFRIPVLDREVHVEVDKEAEKDKLREAIQALDEIGITPQKVVERLLRFLGRRENRERADQAARALQEGARSLTEKMGKSAGDSGRDASAGQALPEQAAGPSASGDQGAGFLDRTLREAGEAMDRAAGEAADGAGRMAGDAVDKAKKTLKEKVAEEIDNAEFPSP